jgi:hypothetical protein
MSMSNYLETAVLNHVLRGTALAQPAGLTVALFTTAASETGGGTEVSGGGYSRKAVTFTVSGNTANNALVDFGTASANWGTISHYGIYDTAATPNLLFWGATKNSSGTDTTFTVNNGDTFQFPASAITITLD